MQYLGDLGDCPRCLILGACVVDLVLGLEATAGAGLVLGGLLLRALDPLRREGVPAVDVVLNPTLDREDCALDA